MNTSSNFRSWRKSAGSKAVITRVRKRETKTSRKFQNAKSSSVGKENEFLNAGSGSWREENKTENLNAGSGGEENKVELKIYEPPMDCRFRQFLVWFMYETRLMSDSAQRQLILDKYGLKFGSSMEFMDWLLDEAVFLSYRYRREFINNVRSGYKIKTRATIDPPSVWPSFNKFLEWVRFETKGMGGTAKEKFVLKYFPGVPPMWTDDFPDWVINQTKGMTSERRMKHVERLRRHPEVSPSYGRIVEAAKGCSYRDFYDWLAGNLENKNDEAQKKFIAEQLPGVPKLLGCHDKSSFMEWVENCTEELGSMAKRAFALRLRVGPELKMYNGDLESLGQVPEPEEGCSFLDFLGWVISACSCCEDKEFLDQNVPGKPRELTTKQFLDWAISKIQDMDDEEDERQFVKKLRSGPELIVDVDDFVISKVLHRDEEADDSRDLVGLNYFRTIFGEKVKEMDDLDWKNEYDEACPIGHV